MKSKIWLSSPHMSGKEIDYINEAFKTNWIAPLGPNVDAFENLLENYLENNKKVACLSSGTAAMHLALLQLGVGYKDEVICQSFTFCGSTNPIKYLGANPVFVDSELETWNMNPFYLEEAIKDRLSKGIKPKAIIIVHLYGMPAKMDEILAIANKYEIPVIEDAAEALGSSYKGKKCGNFGEFAILSFNGNKIITTSGGGALICNSQKKKEKTIFYATQARDKALHYEHSEIGYNYRMSNITAGIGRAQINVLNERVEKRRKNNLFYQHLFKSIEGVTVFSENNDDFYSNHWLSCILFEKNKTPFTIKDFIQKLSQANIETRPLWKPMHLQSVYEDSPYYGNSESEKLFNAGVCLPSGSNLSKEDLERIKTEILTL